MTVSTNMAGRGTDIKLGEGVAELGGLHVICTEMHDASRIDRQLIGRCGRQGDPGTFRQYLALDDDLLLTGLGPEEVAEVRRSWARRRPAPSTISAGSSARPSGRSSAATSAPPQVADVLREGTQEDAAANGPGPVSRHARITSGEETSVGSAVGRIGSPSSNVAGLLDGLPIRPTGKAVRGSRFRPVG